MTTKPKTQNVLLRAFKIKNPNLSASSSNVKENLKTALVGSEKSENRCMDLNQNDDNNEKDLISTYENYDENQSLFCTMLRMAVGNDVQHITQNLLQDIKFSIDDLENENIDTSAIYKEHFYFSIQGDYLVTGKLAGNRTIQPLQTYLSWFLKDEKLELTPMVQAPVGHKLSDLSAVSFSDHSESSTKNSVHSGAAKTQNGQAQSTKSLTDAALSKILHLMKDTESLSDIDLNQIISAELIIKFKKPRKMTQEQYENMLGATLKPISDLENVKIKTKDKKTEVNGKDLLKTKYVTIEKTGNGFLNEKNLIQEMAKYLDELKNENSG